MRGHVGSGLGTYRQHLVGQRQQGRVRPGQLRGVKAGIHGFTKSLALELARKGVTVNTISPGYLATSMVKAVPEEVLKEKILPQIPLGRLGEPDEVAALVAFVCSDAAAFMTGSNIAMNGGQHMY